MQVFIGFDRDRARGVDGPSVGEDEGQEPCHEAGDEQRGERAHAACGAAEDRLVVEVVHKVLAGQRHGQQRHRQAQQHVAPLGDGLQPVPRRRPLRDHRRAALVGQVEAVDGEFRPREEGSHGRADEQRA